MAVADSSAAQTAPATVALEVTLEKTFMLASSNTSQRFAAARSLRVTGCPGTGIQHTVNHRPISSPATEFPQPGK
jgi:hypothetical protein